MNKKMLFGLSFILLSCVSFGAIACGPTSSDNSGEISNVTVSKLIIKKQPNKLEYAVGEAFSSEGLEVSFSKIKDGKIVSEEKTNDYTLSIKDGTILEEGEHEVFVKSTLDGVRSTSFNIAVKQDNVLTPLHEVIDLLVKGNNYTVNNTLAGTNHVKGLITKNALYWESDEEAYFADEGFGYGSYDEKTFRYNIIDNKIENAVYISDLGGHAEDHGLFDIHTVDNMAERRISNFNIQGITTEDIAYLKNDCKPLKDNPNRYQISINHCKWLFNAIAHTQLTIKPEYFLKNGGKVFIEVTKDGLDIDLITADTFDGIKGCVASITNIGTTTIPGMGDFMANPTFTQKATNIEIFQTKINEGNYLVESSDGQFSAACTENYVYGKRLENVDGINYTLINVKENNKLGKQPGQYNLNVVGNEVKVGDTLINKSTSGYLVNFGLFENLSSYFVQDEQMNNKYTYVIDEAHELTSDLNAFVLAFVSDTISQPIKQVNLELIMSGNSVYLASLSFDGETDIIGSITISSFGKAQHPMIENFIRKKLY